MGNETNSNRNESGSNFTGINWENVNGTANLIKNNATSVVHCMYTELTEKFLKPLSESWASENAVEWWKSFSGQLEGDITSVINTYDILLNKISDAVNIWCKRTGNSNRFDKSNSGYDLDDYFDKASGMLGDFQTLGTSIFGLNQTVNFKPQDLRGNSGMDIAVVRDDLLPVMTYTLNNAMEVADAMPTSIGLYDNEGAQLASFGEEVKKIKNTISQLSSNLKSSIEGYMQTEINNTLLAKQEVTNTLNS